MTSPLSYITVREFCYTTSKRKTPKNKREKNSNSKLNQNVQKRYDKTDNIY